MSIQSIRPQVLAGVLIAGLAVAACTKQLPESFRILPAQEVMEAGFETGKEVIETTKAPVDILWVIDNSDSMEPSQTKLKDGIERFAKAYLNPEYDVRMAVITTDAFIADSLFEEFLDTRLVRGSYMGKTPRQINPFWGPDHAKLISGKKDVPNGRGSGRAILETRAPEGANAALWQKKLITDFKTNVAVGTKGLFEERGFASVLQLLKDNETSENESQRLFRKGSQRIIVFLSDEEEQTIDDSKLGAPHMLLYNGYYYAGDDIREGEKILPSHFTNQCRSKVYRGETLKPMSICHKDENLLLPVAEVKARLDAFFSELDGDSSKAHPNYVVVPIVGIELDTIKGLREAYSKYLAARGKPDEISHEPGTRYVELAKLVGNGSFAMDIGVSDYAPILEKIGLVIESRSIVKKFEKYSRYRLERVPTREEHMTVTLVRKDGTEEVIDPSRFELEREVLVITDKALLESFKPGDRLTVHYYPTTILPESMVHRTQNGQSAR